MRISDLDVIPVEVTVKPLDEGGLAPYQSNFSSVTDVRRLLIRLETESGVEGWGEIRPTLSVESATAILRSDVFPEAINRPVWEIGPFLDAFQYEYLSIDPYVGGVEMAMWDAYGRSLDVPVHRLLGGKQRDELPLAAPLGILDPDRSRRYAKRVIEQGYDVLKTKGGRDWQADVERIKAMDEATEGGLEFRLDPNQGYSADEAVRVAARLEDAGVYLQYLEQPVRIDSIGTLKRLRNRLTTPVAVNEDTYYRRNLFNLVREDAIDVAVVDIVPSGGIVEMQRLAAIAAESGVSVAHHDAFDLGIKKAAVLHAVASTPAINLATDTVYPAFERDVITTRHSVAAGTMAVPDGPGLGVEVDRKTLDAIRLDVQ